MTVSGSNDEKANLLTCPQACHLVEKINVQALFIVQSNGKRRICNIKKISWSLDSSVNPFIYCNMSLYLPSIRISISKVLLC